MESQDSPHGSSKERREEEKQTRCGEGKEQCNEYEEKSEEGGKQR